MAEQEKPDVDAEQASPARENGESQPLSVPSGGEDAPGQDVPEANPAETSIPSPDSPVPFFDINHAFGIFGGSMQGRSLAAPPPAVLPTASERALFHNANGHFTPPVSGQEPDDEIPPENPKPQPSPPFGISDPLFPQQWALNNQAYPDVDINVVKVWEDYTGQGVLLGILDDGVEFSHPDLAENYRGDLSYDIKSGRTNPAVFPPGPHGTGVSSMAAGALNGVGIVGVAYETQYSVFNLIGNEPDDPATTEDQIYAKLLSLNAHADVINMSYGGEPKHAFAKTDSQELDTYRAFVSGNRDGLGAVLVHAVGNERVVETEAGDQYQVHNPFTDMEAQHYLIDVAAIQQDGEYASFSSPSASTLVTAPGDKVWGADMAPPNGYSPSSDYGQCVGTSYSSPIVAGVACLMLEANPNLGYRDVQTILAATARRAGNDISPQELPWDWMYNGAENWNGGGMHTSRDYGFGLVDALAAVRVAESWTQPAHTAANLLSDTESAMPVALALASGTASSLALNSALTIEYVSVNVDISGGHPSELAITLTSPDQTTSLLLYHSPEEWESLDSFTHTFNATDDFLFGSTQFRGEDANGEWTLTVTDTTTGNDHTLNAWTISVYGENADADDIYVYTNEYDTLAAEDTSRALLSDDGGTDTINAAAVTADTAINLQGGTASTIDGAVLNIEAGTVIENVHAGDGNDTILGNDADNELFGWRGNDTISGGGGNDLLFGGTGADSLSGGTGTDVFQYADPDNGGDTINDFVHADDVIAFSYRNFGQSGSGSLAEDHFFLNQADVNVNEACFIYEDATLYFDEDGTGAAEAVAIACVIGEDIQADDITFV